MLGIERGTTGVNSSLQSNEGKVKMFNIAKQMRKERKDVIGSTYVRYENGTLKVKEEEVMKRWRIYFLLC